MGFWLTATMSRTALRYAIEHYDKDQRDHYLAMIQAPGHRNGQIWKKLRTRWHTMA